jgi:hypothetical protein
VDKQGKIPHILIDYLIIFAMIFIVILISEFTTFIGPTSCCKGRREVGGFENFMAATKLSG